MKVSAEPRIFLSTQPADPRERAIALAVIVLSTTIFVAAAPFARRPLPEIWPFIPICESALAINDLITAILLVSQVAILRSRSLLAIAMGYFFTALMVIAHLLSVPGLFAPSGAIDGGPQTAAWLYFFWHGGFPLAVIAYAVLKDNNGRDARPLKPFATTIIGAVVAVIVIVAALTLAATKGYWLLPEVLEGSRHTSTMIAVTAAFSLTNLVALVAVWKRRPHSVLDILLIVAMCAWLFDVALSSVLNGGRFDLGFYAGRIYGFLAASVVLFVMLIETGGLYARAARSLERDRLEHERKLNEAAVRTDPPRPAERTRPNDVNAGARGEPTARRAQ